MCVHAQFCPTLCNLMHSSPPVSSVHGIPQARILEWVMVPSSRGSSQPRDQTCISCVSCTVGGFFTTALPGKPREFLPPSNCTLFVESQCPEMLAHPQLDLHEEKHQITHHSCFHQAALYIYIYIYI